MAIHKKTRQAAHPPAGLAFFPSAGDRLFRTRQVGRPSPSSPPRPETGPENFLLRVGAKRLEEVRRALADLESQQFAVRAIAATLNAEAMHLARLYQGLILHRETEGSVGPDTLDVRVVAPLIAHLARGVEVCDIHKLLNVARDPLFDEPARSARGKTAARYFDLEQVTALYVIWRLGHSFHLLPAIRKSIAGQLTEGVLRKVVAGEEIGLAVTPFVAAIGDLNELTAAGYAETVAFSLNGLVCHALRAFHTFRC